MQNLITWVYETNSFVPCAKIVGNETFSIINDYIGRPIQAYDNNGNLVWQTDYDIYGNLRNLKGERNFIPFRQLGQYEDVETGLYYNRFRYYDYNTGTYISKDPIGLLGNNPNLYAYVFDSNMQVDVFGLITYNTMPSIPNYQKHHIIPQQLREHLVIQKAGFNIHNSDNIIYLPKKEGVDINSYLAIHNGPHPEYTSKVLMDLDEILNKASIDLKQGKVWEKEQYNAEIEKTINKYKELLTNGKIQCK